jgi:transposase-like protein
VYQVGRGSRKFGFERLRSNPVVMRLALRMLFERVSLQNVRKSRALRGVNVNHARVWRWIQKYTGLMDEYPKDFTP